MRARHAPSRKRMPAWLALFYVDPAAEFSQGSVCLLIMRPFQEDMTARGVGRPARRHLWATGTRVGRTA